MIKLTPICFSQPNAPVRLSTNGPLSAGLLGAWAPFVEGAFVNFPPAGARLYNSGGLTPSGRISSHWETGVSPFVNGYAATTSADSDYVWVQSPLIERKAYTVFCMCTYHVAGIATSNFYHIAGIRNPSNQNVVMISAYGFSGPNIRYSARPSTSANQGVPCTSPDNCVVGKTYKLVGRYRENSGPSITSELWVDGIRKNTRTDGYAMQTITGRGQLYWQTFNSSYGISLCHVVYYWGRWISDAELQYVTQYPFSGFEDLHVPSQLGKSAPPQLTAKLYPNSTLAKTPSAWVGDHTYVDDGYETLDSNWIQSP